MLKLILIPAAQTEWRAAGRLAGDTDLPLNEQGHRQAVHWASQIAPMKPELVRCGPEQSTKQTASIIAHQLGIHLRTIKELREINLGLWQGLTHQDFEERFPKVHRQWRAEPESIEPPDGETITAVADRLAAGLLKIRRKHATGIVAIPLGQYAFAILRCRLLDDTYDKFWEYVDDEQQPQTVELPVDSVK
jgi:broad specificity phosphatase PhoE